MKTNKYIQYIIKKGIHLQKNQRVEIVGSSYLQDFIVLLKDACLKFGASYVSIRYIDGIELENKISDGYRQYIDSDIESYQDLLEKNFCRITLYSPFTPPMSISNDKREEYLECRRRLEFVQNYFFQKKSQSTICMVANLYWASKLQLTLEELWEEIIRVSFMDMKSKKYKILFSKLHLKSLHFQNELGTNLTVGLTSDFQFQDKTQITSSGIVYQPNIPCLEIYTAPDKYGVNGVLVGAQPLHYRGCTYNNYRIYFEGGKVIKEEGLDGLFSLHPNISYVGEIALALYQEKKDFYSTLWNENFACHLALGQAYPYGIKEISKINTCPYHIDLIFGTKDLQVKGRTEDKEILLMENGYWTYKK